MKWYYSDEECTNESQSYIIHYFLLLIENEVYSTRNKNYYKMESSISVIYKSTEIIFLSSLAIPSVYVYVNFCVIRGWNFETETLGVHIIKENNSSFSYILELAKATFLRHKLNVKNC